MTALPQRPTIDPPTEGYWVKDDGHYAMPMTAFGASVFLPAVEDGIATMCREFGLLTEGEQQRWIGHEVYARTVPYGARRWPAGPAWTLGLLVRLSPELRRRAGHAEQAIRTALPERHLTVWERETRELFRLDSDRLRARPLSELDDTALLDHLDEGIDLLRRGNLAHFRLWFSYGPPVRALVEACNDLFGWDASGALGLLAGESRISSEAGRRLAELATVISRWPGAREALEQGGPDLVARLGLAAPEAASAVAEFIESYGHRTMSDDPGDPTLAERVDLVTGMLRDRVREPALTLVPDAPTRMRDRRLLQARTMLADRPSADRDRFERALGAAQRAYPVRDETIFYGGHMPGAVLRYAALEIGRRLTERGQLERVEDAVHLSVDELGAALRDQRRDEREIAARRRAERAWIVAHPGPPSYGRPDPPPDLGGLRGAFGRLNRAWLGPSMTRSIGGEDALGGDREVAGVPGSPGRHAGPVRIIRDEREFDRLRRGDVLVCHTASSGWSFLFAQAGALVTEVGSANSHPAIIAREYGIPAVLATGDAARRLVDGQSVVVDGSAGRVYMESL